MKQYQKFLNLIFLVCFQVVVSSQQKNISGIVLDNNNETIPFANIIIQNQIDKESIGYGYSDEDGSFSIKIPIGINEILINVTAIGFKETTVHVKTDGKETLKVILEKSVTQLKEVTISAKIKKDTLGIDTDSMNLKKENTLRDILNKTEGMLVSKEGGISYQGKQINKILINGKEVFINQNKIALDNLNYEIMDNVQVINNYKDKFTIDFNRIRDPVLNISTKSEFKGILKTNLKLGYGFNNKYNFKGKGFFFSDKFNAFSTSLINNIGELELSQRDVASPVNKYKSNFLKKNLSPFFIKDLLVEKSFVANNSLTIRHQGNKSKLGFVFYHGNFNKARETTYNTFDSNSLIRNSIFKNKYRGDFISSTFNLSRILNSKTIFQNLFSLINVTQNTYRSSANNLFSPIPSFFGEEVDDMTRSITFLNSLKFTKLLNKKTALDFGIDFYYEKNKRDFDTYLTNLNDENILLREKYKKMNLSFFSNLKFRIGRNSSLNTGFRLMSNNEKGKLDFKLQPVSNSLIERRYINYKLSSRFQGSKRKLDYSFYVAPSNFQINNRNIFFLETSNTLTYNFEQQNNLILNYERKNQFYHLNSLYKKIIRSYNSLIINQEVNPDDFSVINNISLNWFNSNVARSKRIHAMYKFTREQNFFESILDSIEGNSFYFSTKVFDKKDIHEFDLGIGKGIYLGKKYNRFDIGSNLKYNIVNYPTLVNKALSKVNVISLIPSFNLSFSPRNSFIKEIKNNTSWNFQNYEIGESEATNQRTFTNILTFIGNENIIDWNLDFEYKIIDLENNLFKVPDINLSLNYDLSEKIQLSLKGQSLLTLFDLNNYTFITTLSQGNLLTQLINNDNIGFLILSASLKL